jgi:hypothetical protein
MRKINGKPLTKAQAMLAAEKDTPADCGHRKQLVEIEIFPGGADSPDEVKRSLRVGWLCPKCKYRRVTPRLTNG